MAEIWVYSSKSLELSGSVKRSTLSLTSLEKNRFKVSVQISSPDPVIMVKVLSLLLLIPIFVVDSKSFENGEKILFSSFHVFFIRLKTVICCLVNVNFNLKYHILPGWNIRGKKRILELKLRTS